VKTLGATPRGHLLGAVIALLFVLALPASAAAGGFTRAFTDDSWFTGSPSADSQWVTRTSATGAKMVLLEVDWISIEPTAPSPGVDPTNPAGAQYNFGYLDSRIREFANSGLQVALLVTDAPRWAEAPGGPSLFEADGAWEPNATAYGQMATALAKRYSGSYPDPQNPGTTLPRVKYYQAWAEANFSVHLAPQWTSSGSPNGPQMYRSLLNAFYDGVKSVHSDNFVITTGFGPYGDAPGSCVNQEVGNGCRMHPALFAQQLLCLSSALRRASCPNPAHFDALAMDPYEVASPTTGAFSASDISAPDLWKLQRILKKARKAGTALPSSHKQLWVTEFSYDSDPPNPGGVSLTTQARWLEEALYLFWKQGVSTAVWYLVRDQTATYNQANYYSGVYFYNGNPKPSLRAYQFPFLVWPNGRHETVWGIAPKAGRVTVQRQHGRSWTTLFKVRVSAGGVFKRSIKGSLHGKFRAVVGGTDSLTWKR
jgi:hypothetical protein